MQNPSRDHNKKTIVVSGTLVYTLQLKLKATYEQWRDLHHSFDEDETSITIGLIEPYICVKGGKEEREHNLRLIRDYATSDPAAFSWGIYSDFVCRANVLNPLVVSKSRGGSPYMNVDMVELKRVSRWLYVFLRFWLKQPNESWPEEFKGFLRKHHIIIKSDSPDDYDVERLPKDVVLACIQAVNPELQTEVEDFYINYISRKSLTRIKRALSSVNFAPSKFPLKEFLKM